MVLAGGCEGPVGPAGKDVPGVDVVPPTIELIEPWPLSEVWDSIDITATAVDNVAINQVVLFFDGSSFIDDQVMIFTEPPYSASIDLKGLEAGWHFVSARAYDTANNLTDTPLVPVKVGFSSDLNDTLITLRYNSGKQAAIWTLPDTSFTTTYWVRFSVARECSLKHVSIMLGGSISDTAEVKIGIRFGDRNPSARDSAAIVLRATDIDDSLQERRIDFSSDSLQIDRDFFVVLSLDNSAEGDTIRLAADEGDPHWGRSGCGNEDGWFTLSQCFRRRDNFIINSDVFYEHVPEDTTSQH